MKVGLQTSLPFLDAPKEKASGLSLNRDKFIQYMTKSVEVDASQAEHLFLQIREELDQFHGKNPLEYLEKILSTEVKKFQVKKPASHSAVNLTKNAEIVLKKRYLRNATSVKMKKGKS